MPLAHFVAGFMVLMAMCASIERVPAAAPSVRLQQYPQKIVTRFTLEDKAVPREILSNSSTNSGQTEICEVRASDGAVWQGTTNGLIRLDPKANEQDRRQYFAGKRYLSDDQVEKLLADGNGGVWVRTRRGVDHIEMRPMTLASKADYFEQRIRARHDRYGMIADCRLEVPGDVSTFRLVDNDNDGLWTSIYVAAECFRFQVTKAPEALTQARKSMEAMLFLEEVAGRRGFPARSYVRKGDPMPTGGEWHWTENGKYYWKGDTSSDEIVGHFFAFSVAYDSLPDEGLKQRITETARRIMDHILEHDYNLVDLDDQPTLWGWWGPRKLAQEPDERALNSLQLLSFLKTAHHITGDAKYDREYRKVATEFKYAELIARLNEFRTELNYSDEELAMLPLYCLFRYEKDPALLKAYRRAADEWWKNIRREANPLWTMIYLTGRPDADVDLKAAVHTLYRTPMDTITWTVRNTGRGDVKWANERDRFGHHESLTLLPPDERPVMRWNSNPFVVDGGDGGHSEDDGAAFLLPYWMGRYHRFLKGE